MCEFTAIYRSIRAGKEKEKYYILKDMITQTEKGKMIAKRV